MKTILIILVFATCVGFGAYKITTECSVKIGRPYLRPNNICSYYGGEVMTGIEPYYGVWCSRVMVSCRK